MSEASPVAVPVNVRVASFTDTVLVTAASEAGRSGVL